jgi:hypothetical protein
MGVHIRPTKQEATPDKPVEHRGLWGWLKRKDNRTVLQFVGAGIVAVIGLLSTMGVFHQPSTPKTQSVSSAPAVPPASQPLQEPQSVNQNATSYGGVAANMTGPNNKVVVGK